ncbi:MAG: MEDS domain-containing protein [Acidobacteriota bacterium]
MAPELRKTGISVVGDVPWGTHFCHFYETKQDLVDTLVPYFKAGLESNEFCVWVVSTPELITVEEAKGALAQAVPDLDRHLSEENIEVLNGLEWYLEKSVFNLERVMRAWDAKLKRALARGHDGMRVSGDTFWLAEKDWKDFFAYEKQLNESIIGQHMTVLCTYPLAKSGAAEVLDVVQAHQFAIARRQGEWEVIETPELIQAKAEIRRLNEELEQRVVERTGQLAKAIKELTDEIFDRKQSEVELSLAHQRLSYHVENTPLAVIEWDKDLFIKRWSKRAEEVFGWTASEALGINMYDRNFPVVHEEDAPAVAEIAGQLIKGTVNRNLGLNRNYTKDGNVIYCEWYNSVLRDEDGNVITILSLVHDVTERKHAEALLHAKEQEFRAIVENAPDQIIRYDRNFRRTYVNPAVGKAFGLPVEALIGKPIGSVIQDAGLDVKDDELAQIRQRIAAVFDTGRSYEYEITWPTPAGGRDYSVRLFPELDLNGSVINVLGISRDITERKEAEEKLKATSEQLRALSARLQSAREEEGARIARELHDELGSALTSLKWDLERIDKVSSESGNIDASGLRASIKGMMGLIDATINTVIRISTELRPGVLDDLGLAAAIEWQAQQFEARTGIICRFDSLLDNPDLSGEQTTAIFRILQEALTNILRHSQATRVNIMIEERDGDFVLEVRDDGRGITEEEKAGPRSLGLIGMRERAHLAEGTIEIIGAAGKGTVLFLRVPIKDLK